MSLQSLPELEPRPYLDGNENDEFVVIESGGVLEISNLNLLYPNRYQGGTSNVILIPFFKISTGGLVVVTNSTLVFGTEVCEAVSNDMGLIIFLLESSLSTHDFWQECRYEPFQINAASVTFVSCNLPQLVETTPAPGAREERGTIDLHNVTFTCTDDTDEASDDSPEIEHTRVQTVRRPSLGTTRMYANKSLLMPLT